MKVSNFLEGLGYPCSKPRLPMSDARLSKNDDRLETLIISFVCVCPFLSPPLSEDWVCFGFIRAVSRFSS